MNIGYFLTIDLFVNMYFLLSINEKISKGKHFLTHISIHIILLYLILG